MNKEHIKQNVETLAKESGETQLEIITQLQALFLLLFAHPEQQENHEERAQCGQSNSPTQIGMIGDDTYQPRHENTTEVAKGGQEAEHGSTATRKMIRRHPQCAGPEATARDADHHAGG